MMEYHVQSHCARQQRSRAATVFYDALFAEIGASPAPDDPWGRLVYVHSGAKLVITRPIDGNAAFAANGGTVGFAMEDGAQVKAWHSAGTTNGGTSVEDAPGVRETLIGNFFLAYLRDPDGNKLCGQYEM